VAIPAPCNRGRARRNITSAWRFGLPALTAIIAIACLSSIAVVGTYYTNMLRYGGVKEWTDAIYPAVEALPAMEPSHVCFLDWGFTTTCDF
jgi:hypothetical protein